MAHHRSGAFLFALLIASFGFVGCAGFVAGNNGNPPPITLAITNVLTGPATTSSCQVDWTTNIPADSAVDYGTSTVFGSSTPVDPAMVTSHQIVLSGLAPGTVYYYQVRSTDSKNSNAHSGSHSFKTSGGGPSITMQPTSQTVTAGQAASFTVAATGTVPLNYQWQKNGVSIAGATAASYTTPATTTSDSGSTFRVVVSNSVGSATSAIATLTVNAGLVAPTISTQPASQTVTAGQTAVFTVVASGTTPLNYQWQKNSVNIVGATAASYTTPATTTSDSGSTFRVVVSNTAGTMASAAVTLTVNAVPVAPTITTQPANQTVTAGQTAAFAVVANGTAPLNYQWQKNGVSIAGATAASYTTPATTTSDSGSTFRVVVSNSVGSATSAIAMLTVNAAPVAPTISTQPANQTVTAGQTAAFTVVATGTTPLSYQWQKNSVNIVGATAASYTTSATTMPDSGSTFRVVVSNTAGAATSALATLTVTAVAPSILTPPISQTVNAGQTASFSVAATGTAPLGYQWNRNGVAISGATSASYTTAATTNSDNGSQFTVVVTNTAGSVTSSAATLTVNAQAVQITTGSLPAGQAQTAYSSTLQATGGTPPYTWSLSSGLLPNGLSLSSSGTISGTPTLVGLFNLVVRVDDSVGASASTALTINIAAQGPIVAFPGAQGGGALSLGGRGGTVYLVTNTADSGVGSLRACINASGPRSCVFRTGGTIALLSTLTVANPFITIAGQSAPGGGIQITGPSGAGAPGNPSIVVKTHDVVIQYLRIRRGHNSGEICNQNPWSCGSSLEILAGSGTDTYNIVFDHVSAQWSNYDALIILGSHAGVNASQPRLVTLSHSIIGEELAGAGQTTATNTSGYSGDGSTVPDLMTDIDFHHNLFAGASHRLPLITIKSARLVNNYIYAWTYYGTRTTGLRDIIGNYFAYRSGQTFVSHEIQAWVGAQGNDTSFAPSFYLAGNMGPSDSTGTSNWLLTGLSVNEAGGEVSSPLSTAYQRSSRIPTPAGYAPIVADPVTSISTASGVLLNTTRAAPYDGVGASRRLDCKGNWVDAQDSVDRRIVNAVANGTTLFGSYTYSSLATSPQSQADLGGWPTLAAGTACVDSNNNGIPDVWESYWGNAFGLGSTLNPNGLNFGDGYTDLEHYIAGVSPAP